MRTSMTRSSRRRVVLVACSGCSPSGLSGASPARSPPTSRRRPARRQGHPAPRLDQRPGQPQPVHRVGVIVLRDLGAQLRPAGRLPCLRLHEPAGHRSRHRLGDVRGRQGLDLHDRRGRHVAGRRAADRLGRRLHVQLRDRQRDGHVHRLHDLHREGRGHGRHPRRLHLLEAQGQHARPLDADPARAHLEQGRSRQGRARLQERPADRRARDRSRRSSGRRASTSAWRPTRTTGRAPPRSTRSSSRPTRTPTPWRRT